MIATICQPEHLPWLGWFDKASRVELLVLLDNVQFKKRYFENRNRIRTATGWCYLTVPVLSKGRFLQKIQEVEIDTSRDWQPEHWKALQLSYARAPFFKDYADSLALIYLGTRWDKLAALNRALIEWGLARLGLTPKLALASDLGIEDKASALLARICERVGANAYLSGISGRDYLDESEFARRGVRVCYQEFRHPRYEQIHGPFEPCMSFVDLLFNHGPRSQEILLRASDRLETVFL